MENNISYSNLYYTLDELYDQLKSDNNYPKQYLEALKNAQNAILVLELLNLSRSSKPKIN